MSLILSRSGIVALGAMGLLLTEMGQAATIPAHLTKGDVRSITKLIVMPASHKAYTAHSLMSDGDLGLDFGLDATFVPRRNLLSYGDQRGVAPRIIPVPRFWLSFDLPEYVKFSTSYAPSNLYDGIMAAGAAFQWAFWRNPDQSINVSTLFAYTYTSVFGDLNAHATDLTVQVSKDLLVWQPYAGAGFMVAHAKADRDMMAAGQADDRYSTFATHFYLGARIDFVAKLSFQIDLINLKPAAGLLLQTSL